MIRPLSVVDRYRRASTRAKAHVGELAMGTSSVRTLVYRSKNIVGYNAVTVFQICSEEDCDVLGVD